MNHRVAEPGQDEWLVGLKVESRTDTQLIILPASFLCCVLFGEKPQNFKCGFKKKNVLTVSMFSDVFTQFYDSSGPRDLLM